MRNTAGVGTYASTVSAQVCSPMAICSGVIPMSALLHVSAALVNRPLSSTGNGLAALAQRAPVYSAAIRAHKRRIVGTDGSSVDRVQVSLALGVLCILFSDLIDDAAAWRADCMGLVLVGLIGIAKATEHGCGQVAELWWVMP